MYDSGKIITGLVIALIVLLFPFWYNFLDGPFAAPKPPEPKVSEELKKTTVCILPRAEMRTGHMQLLDEWRNRVVRDAQRFYVELPAPAGERPEMIFVKGARDFIDHSVLEFPGVGPLRYLTAGDDQRLNTGAGKMVQMSLQNTCMACHTSKKDFCDQCHNYSAVIPTCWNCHVEPEEKK
ncbi:MAG: hypothetical protein AB1896_05690 [Thermodesulfobacteriota bacterium]